jgi:proteasome assembly chaperone (PAC2) family protein
LCLLKTYREPCEKPIDHAAVFREAERAYLDKTYFHQISKQKLTQPTLVVGLPGFGNVGKIATRLLVKFAGAKPFAELYSPLFPDYVLINSEGICRPPRYEFYASATEKRSLMILTGDTQPSLDDVIAHYELCSEILDYAQGFGMQFLVVMGGVPVPVPKKEVYVAATSSALATEIMEKGAIIYGKGRIMGGTGLFLGLAKKRGLSGVCLLGATTGMRADKSAGLEVFKLLNKILGTEVNEAL